MNVPQGELTIQTLAMPKDTNANGDIFGGWLLSQMDLACGVLSKQIAKGRITTVAIKEMCFIHPVKVGDIVSCHTSLLKKGRTSMTIMVDVWANLHASEKRKKVTTGTFVSVAIDKNGRPRPIDD